jgi:hypothetical protein
VRDHERVDPDLVTAAPGPGDGGTSHAGE